MKRVTRLLIFGVLLVAGTTAARGQALKVNTPLLLAGTPNLGFEMTLSRQFSFNADVLWMPYLFKKNEEVYRAFIGSVDLRYYFKPKYYYTNDMFDGFYMGPYVEGGNFNMGYFRGKGRESKRYKGWGLSAGISLGYKFYISRRFRLDLNMGLGYAHLQYDVYRLGGEWAQYPVELKATKAWVGPTKFGIHLVYNLFR